MGTAEYSRCRIQRGGGMKDYSNSTSRAYKGKSEAEIAEMKKKQVIARTKYWENKKNRKNYSIKMKKFWKNVSEEKKAEIKKKQSEKHILSWSKRAQEERDAIYAKMDKKSLIKNHRRTKSRIVEKDIRRTNDYCGVITLSELESLND